MLRVQNHPVLGEIPEPDLAISVDGKAIPARSGEPIAAAMMGAGIRKMRVTARFGNPRGVYCGIGRCTDCVMVVNGKANVRTCVTPVEDGMRVETQIGLGG